MKRDFIQPRLCFLFCCCLITAFTSSCVKLPRRASVAGEKAPAQTTTNESATPPRISLNRATREELEKLPGIGPALAARIIEQRQHYGPFRRAEHLIMVRGISDRRFRQMRALVTVE
ncbi:MAG: helix-hairpin-helix domain-containing protein [Acidobacteria bacterium]|nr:helix-hairpin-helix domain-containing protein [Acidobacteriota bacterium]